MTERDYLLVSRLERMRAAMRLLGEATPGLAAPETRETWQRVMADCDAIVSTLEAAVDRERDKDG